jgi:hypothetical protein
VEHRHGGQPAGKILTLRALEARGEDEDPVAFAAEHVQLARLTGESYMTAWRLAYELAPNDPRFLELTEDEILEDLLVRRFHFDHMHRLLHPKEAAVEEMARTPARSAAKLDKVRAALLADPAVQRGLQKLGLGDRTERPPAPVARVTLRTTTALAKGRTAP